MDCLLFKWRHFEKIIVCFLLKASSTFEIILNLLNFCVSKAQIQNVEHFFQT
jgi:hypothetical protein